MFTQEHVFQSNKSGKWFMGISALMMTLFLFKVPLEIPNYILWISYTISMILFIFFSIHIPTIDLTETSFFLKYSPGIFFAILPAIAARPCYERGLTVPGHIGLSSSLILMIAMVLRYINM